LARECLALACIGRWVLEQETGDNWVDSGGGEPRSCTDGSGAANSRLRGISRLNFR
jgi:hypothetical protein